MNTTLDQWRSWQNARGLSPRTIEDRVLTLRRLGEFTPERITEFLGDTSLTQNSRATYYSHLRAYAKWLLLTDQISVDPMAKLLPPRRARGVPRPIEDNQLVAVLRAANRKRTRTMVLLGALAGLRVHEIAKMRGDHIDLWTGKLTVKGKGGKTATIDLHELLVEEARSYPRQEWWFPSYSSMGASLPHIGRQAVSAAIGDAMQRAGVNATAHQLRHWYGTGLLAQGVDVRVVQTMMRHESIQSTQIYTRVADDRGKAAIKLLRLPDRPPSVAA